MWLFKLTLPIVNVTNEIADFANAKQWSRSIDYTVNKGAELIIETKEELSLNILNRYYQESPPLIKKSLKETLERNHTYLEGLFGTDPSEVNIGQNHLQTNKRNFVICDNWDPYGIKPFENSEDYHKRLTTLFNVQAVMHQLSVEAETANLVWNEHTSICFKGYNLNLYSYFNALKSRERRRIIPVVKRIINNGKIIKETRQANIDLVLNNQLSDCK